MSVFISYSRADTVFVDLLYRLLDSKGFDTWVDRRGIDAGSRWDNEIEQAIQGRTHMIVVLSPEAVASQNVADEWSYALDEKKTVIPLYYKTCSVPMRLRRVQAIDFVKKEFAMAFEDLQEALGAPDRRPDDRIELAKRDGLIFIGLPQAGIDIVFEYARYPAIGSFLNTVWFTLLWSMIPRGTTAGRCYDYGVRWALKNKTSGDIIQYKDGDLLHEIGIEPNSELEVVLLKG